MSWPNIHATKQGDDLSKSIFDDAIEYLGIGIAGLVNLFHPEAVVIGGGVEKAGEVILGPIRRTIRRFAFEEPAGKVRIVASILGEDAVALGAASLVLREIFTQS